MDVACGLLRLCASHGDVLKVLLHEGMLRNYLWHWFLLLVNAGPYTRFLVVHGILELGGVEVANAILGRMGLGLLLQCLDLVLDVNLVVFWLGNCDVVRDLTHWDAAN